MSANRPESPDALAATLRRLGRIEEAIEVLEREISSSHAPKAMARLSAALIEAGRVDDAIERAMDAVQLAPLASTGHEALGRALATAGEYEESVRAFRTSAQMRRQSSCVPGKMTLPAHFVVHILEQLDYVERTSARELEGVVPASGRRDLLAQLTTMLDGSGGSPPFVAIGGADAHRLLALPFWAPAQTQIGRVLGERADFRAADAAFLAEDNGFATVDDVLSETALDSLRRFCMAATVWRRPYKFGYVGAFPEDGFASRVIFEISEAMQAALPGALGGHRLVQWWAFAYDSRFPGTDIHGDDSDVSVNLWITPSNANLDPDRGGLIMWDRAAPADWTFDDYNSGGPRVREWLTSVRAQATVVPHRANRAILFRGRQLHCSDGTRFAPGFESRRRNLTLLYRRRHRPVDRASSTNDSV